MANPITYQSQSARFGLPYLFSGQAQKEFYINETTALVDALLHPVVEGRTSTPPVQSRDGDCWIVDASASGVWTGQDDQIACSQSGSWLFARPSEDMRVFDRSSGTSLRYRSGWQLPTPVPPPSGGSNVDVEARAAIADLINALVDLGIVQ